MKPIKNVLIASLMLGMTSTAFADSLADRKSEQAPYGALANSQLDVNAAIEKVRNGNSEMSNEEILKSLGVSFVSKRHMPEYADLNARDFRWESAE